MILLESGSNKGVINKNGQKALYWIIAKCPDIVRKLL